MLEEICTMENAASSQTWARENTSNQSNSFAIKAETNEHEVVFWLSGKLTFHDCKIFEQAFEDLELKNRELILDFKGLDFIDSAGLGMLLLLKERYKSVYFREVQGEPKKFIEIAQVISADHFI